MAARAAAAVRILRWPHALLLEPPWRAITLVERDASAVCSPPVQALRDRTQRLYDRARISDQLSATAETGIALLAVCRRVEGDFIGLIVGRASVDEPEIAYALYQRVHGCGYATETAEAILKAAVATGRTRLWSTVRSWNVASLRVLDKLRFEQDHVSVDDLGELVWLTRELV
jgi:RimJ/RimL family protein N-acetyltransferase